MAYSSDVAQQTVDDTYAEFGRTAVYTAFAGGGPVPCTVIVDLRDSDARPDDGRPIAGQITIEVRKTEIPQPAQNDVFVFDIGGRSVTVMNRPWVADEEGLTFMMWAR